MRLPGRLPIRSGMLPYQKRAKELGYKTLRFDTTVLQEVAQHFYMKNGHAKVDRGKAHGFDVIYYEKRLDL